MLFNKTSFYSKLRFVGRELLYSYVTRKLVASQHKKFGIFKNGGGGGTHNSLAAMVEWLLVRVMCPFKNNT